LHATLFIHLLMENEEVFDLVQILVQILVDEIGQLLDYGWYCLVSTGGRVGASV
jgi:hypothetical protein